MNMMYNVVDISMLSVLLFLLPHFPAALFTISTVSHAIGVFLDIKHLTNVAGTQEHCYVTATAAKYRGLFIPKGIKHVYLNQVSL